MNKLHHFPNLTIFLQLFMDEEVQSTGKSEKRNSKIKLLFFGVLEGGIVDGTQGGQSDPYLQDVCKGKL